MKPERMERESVHVMGHCVLRLVARDVLPSFINNPALKRDI